MGPCLCLKPQLSDPNRLPYDSFASSKLFVDLIGCPRKWASDFCAGLQIVLHLSNFVEPRQQSQIVRIVFMVPTYSVTAFLSLRFIHW